MKEIWVTSSSDAKISRAIGLGATGGFNYTNVDWSKKMVEALRGKLTKVVDGAGGSALNSYVRAMAQGGIIATYGATARNPKCFDITRLFLKNIELRGSTMGSPRDFQQLLAFVRRHAIVPIVDSVISLQLDGNHDEEDSRRVRAGFERMRLKKQFGKIVFTLGADSTTRTKIATAATDSARGVSAKL